jgi:NADH-quinone oxidoreductase subunit J
VTTRPELVDMDGSRLLPGLAAVALFLVMAAAFLTAGFGASAGFPGGSITASIGYAMFDLLELAPVGSEGFLITFLIIALVLDAALEAAVMLARREEEGEPLATYDEADTDASAGEADPAAAPGVAADGGSTGRSTGGSTGGER